MAMKPPRTLHRMPELLAPAGSPEALRAAVAAGADAVYLSGKRFGARRYAANFTDTEIEEAIRFSHSRGVKVYVTVNTLIHDRELASVAEYLIWLYATGADAVLIQDCGLAEIARSLVPGLSIHASTQMTVHNAPGVRRAAESGFSRVVLARELSLDEVRAIADETKDLGIGLEIFAHGALCYGYSGQCLLSSSIGGRSGNRGMCAQPCRKAWSILAGSVDDYGRPGDLREVTVHDQFLLSPRDLCTYRRLAEIAESPVASLKIEGRMKSPEYVATVVSVYRRALDAIACGTFVPSPEAERDLLLAFNRGFTEGYLFRKRHADLMGRTAPDNRGLRIGSVVRYDRQRSAAVVRMTAPVTLQTGDGILFAHPGGNGETGFALNTLPEHNLGNLIIRTPRPVPAGSEVYLTFSRDLEARARQIISAPPAEERKIPLDLVAAVSPEGILSVTGTLERPDGTIVPLTSRPEATLIPAVTLPLTADAIKKQLRKCGGTPFAVRGLDLDYRGGRFAPVAEINRLRRELLAAAEEQLAASYRPPTSLVRQVQHRWQQENSRPAGREGRPALPEPHSLLLVVCTDTAEGAREAAAAGAGMVCCEPRLTRTPRTCGGEGALLHPGAELHAVLLACRQTGIPLIWKLPRITHDRFLHAALLELRPLMAEGLAGIMADSYGAAAAVHGILPEVPVAGFSGLNIFNHASVMASKPLFSSVTISTELSRDEIADLMSALAARDIAADCAIIAGGTREVLVTEDCLRLPARRCSRNHDAEDDRAEACAIRDDHGIVYPVYAADGCRSVITDPSEICLVTYLPWMQKTGIARVIVDARHRSPAYVRTVTGIWRRGVDHAAAHPSAGEKDPFLVSLRSELERVAAGGITTGYFLRGLKE